MDEKELHQEKILKYLRKVFDDLFDSYDNNFVYYFDAIKEEVLSIDRKEYLKFVEEKRYLDVYDDSPIKEKEFAHIFYSGDVHILPNFILEKKMYRSRFKNWKLKATKKSLIDLIYWTWIDTHELSVAFALDFMYEEVFLELIDLFKLNIFQRFTERNIFLISKTLAVQIDTKKREIHFGNVLDCLPSFVNGTIHELDYLSMDTKEFRSCATVKFIGPRQVRKNEYDLFDLFKEIIENKRIPYPSISFNEFGCHNFGRLRLKNMEFLADDIVLIITAIKTLSLNNIKFNSTDCFDIDLESKKVGVFAGFDMDSFFPFFEPELNEKELDFKFKKVNRILFIGFELGGKKKFGDFLSVDDFLLYCCDFKTKNELVSTHVPGGKFLCSNLPNAIYHMIKKVGLPTQIYCSTPFEKYLIETAIKYQTHVTLLKDLVEKEDLNSKKFDA